MKTLLLCCLLLPLGAFGANLVGLKTLTIGDGGIFTLTAAKNAAQPGTTIIVPAGVYAENDLLKNGVNWFFQPGAVVNYTNTAALNAGGGDSVPNDTTTFVKGIFDDRNSGAITSNIGGFGKFFVNNRGFTLLSGTLVVTNVNSYINFSCSEIGYAMFADGAQAGIGSRAAIFVTNCSYVSITCDRIYGLRGSTFDTGQLDTSSSPILWVECGTGIYWKLGPLYVTCKAIENIASYSIWADQPAGNSTAAEMWVSAQLIRQHIYTDGGATAGGLTGSYNWKVWITAEEIDEGISCFDYGRIYITAQKINAQSSPNSFSGAVQVWLNAQKISNASSAASWMVLLAGNPSGTGCPIINASVIQMDDPTGTISTGGIQVSGAATQLYLAGASMKTGGTSVGILHSSGTTRLSGCTIDTTSVNAAGSNPVKIAGAGLILDKCVLIAPALADSATAGSAQTLTAYAVKTNKAKNANVTVNVDAFTVDANVR